jgi:hypothetical protein
MFCFWSKYAFLSFDTGGFYENVHSMENEIQVNSDGFGSFGNDQERLRVMSVLLLLPFDGRRLSLIAGCCRRAKARFIPGWKEMKFWRIIRRIFGLLLYLSSSTGVDDCITKGGILDWRFNPLCGTVSAPVLSDYSHSLIVESKR